MSISTRISTSGAYVKTFVRNNWPAFALMGMAAFAKLLGFLRNSLIAYFFGASRQADLLGILIFPTDFITSYLVNNTIITALTIYFAKQEVDKLSVFWRTFHFYRVILTLGAVVLAIIMAFSYPDVPWYLALLSALPGVLYGLAGIIQSYLNYNRVFVWPGAQELIGQVFLLLGIILASHFGVWAYVVVLFGTGIIRILIQVPDLKRFIHGKYDIRELFGLTKFRFEKELLLFVGPLLLTFILSGIPGFLVLGMLNKAGEGMIAAYNYANKVVGVFSPIVVIPLTTYLIPTMGRRIREGRSVKGINVAALAIIGGLATLFALVLVFAPESVVRIIYAHGKFDQSALELTSLFLKFQGFAVIGYALMYYLLQLTLLGSKTKQLIWSYVVGTVSTVALLYTLPYIQYVTIGIANIVGTLISIIVLII